MAAAELERAASAVIVAELAADERRWDLERFPPAGVLVPRATNDPGRSLARLRASLAAAGQPDCFAACELSNGSGVAWWQGASRMPCALALAAAEAGARGRAHWIRSAGALAGRACRASGIDLVLPSSTLGELDGFGDERESASRRACEHREGLLAGGTWGCLASADALALDACALARGPDFARGGWSGALLADARDGPDRCADGLALARALERGCDGILLRGDARQARAALLATTEAGQLSRAHLLERAQRMRALRDRLRQPPLEPRSRNDARDPAGFALEATQASLCQSGHWTWRLGRPCELLAPLHPVASLEARSALERLRLDLAGSSRPAGALLPVVAESALDSLQLAEIDAKLAALRELGWPVGMLWLASPRWLPASWWGRKDAPVLLAFEATTTTLEAVRIWLQGGARANGSLPCRLG
jgi:hypothetical protein